VDAHRRDIIMTSSTSSGVTDHRDGGRGGASRPWQLQNRPFFSWHFDI